MNIFFEIHQNLPREGPGSDISTRKAYESIENLPPNPKILDVGCGPGKQTVELAKLSDGQITAIDTHKPFLEQLKKNSIKENLSNRIRTLNMSMFEMDFARNNFDLIWSEGAIYFLGFKKGLREFRKYLKPKGYIAVSEAVWLKDNRPSAVEEFWKEYEGIESIENKLNIIKNENFNIVEHFVLPESDWMDEYYTPIEKRLKELRENYHDNEDVMREIENHQKEVNIYRNYSDYYGYSFFVMQDKLIFN